tara:strand:- start:162 stop:323 length:162 start_codon:yes stop_codon:yes gene_type:complete
MKHRPEFEGKNHCNQCELDAQNLDEKYCECDESVIRQAGVHPQTCVKCDGVIE